MPLPTGTVTFLFTDIEGSTALARAHPAEFESARQWHHAFLRAACEAHGGYVFQVIGDAFCVAFATATAALAAAVEAQRKLTEDGARQTADGRPQTTDDTRPTMDGEPSSGEGHQAIVRRPSSAVALRVRMGLHTGPAEARDGDYHGYLTLAHVQRVMSVAFGGQTLVSQATCALLHDHLPDGVSLRDMGEHRLKGLLNPEHLWQVVAAGLPDAFPPLASLNAVPNNLPIQVTSFVGRERELAELKQLLPGTRLLTLTGSGGTGKTRLSLELAATFVETARRAVSDHASDEPSRDVPPQDVPPERLYTDGVWFVELAPLTDPALVAITVASILGVREEQGRPLQATLLDWLRPKRLLLVLDNCEHLIEACARFADAVLHAGHETRILASSREALGISGELAWRVPSLEIPNPNDQIPTMAGGQQSAISSQPSAVTSEVGRGIDGSQQSKMLSYASVRLFVERASFANAAFRLTDANAPAVVQICSRLDGIPLAIELAAARVKLFPPEQIATRLDDRFRLLTGGSRTALPRQQTLRSLIDWSHNLLSEPERVLLRRFSVFAGGWTLEAAQAVCVGDHLDEYELVELLSHLVDKSLVVAEEQAGSARYRMLETIRQYARENLLDTGEGERLRDLHLAFFLKLAEQAESGFFGPQEGLWLNRLEAEHANLRAAIDYSLRSSDVALGLRLAGALNYFWHQHHHTREGRAQLARILLRAEDQQNSARAKALNAAGYLAWLEHDYDTARSLLMQGLTLSKELDDKWNMTWALQDLAVVSIAQSDSAQAQVFLEESLKIQKELGNERGVSDSLHFMGEVAMLRNDFLQALTLFDESLSHGQAVNYFDGLGILRKAQAKLHLGDPEQAATLCRQCLKLDIDNGGTTPFASLALAGAVSAGLGEYRRAAQLLGVVDALLKSYHAHLLPFDQHEFDAYTAAVRAQLDEVAFDAAWAAGRALTMEQAVALALDEGQQSFHS